MIAAPTIATNKKHRFVDLEFSHPQMDILESTAAFNLLHCGVGFGKTFLIGVKNYLYTQLYPHVRGFIGANTFDQLNRSTLVGVFKFWASIGLRRNVDYVVGIKPPAHFKIYGEPFSKYNNIISFINGKLIFLASLDNFEMISGMEFAHADLDETWLAKEEAVKEVITARLRQKGLWITKTGQIITDEDQAIREDLMGFCPLNIYTSPAKALWLSEWFNLEEYYDEITDCIFSKTNYFRKRKGNKFVVIASSYHNEHNQPKGYIEEKLIEPNAHNPHRINMLVYGSPIGKVGNEYYNTFDRLKHIKEREAPPNSVTHFSFDFNRGPYITLGCYNIWLAQDNKWEVHKFDEICLPPPHNTTEHLCDRAKEMHSHRMRNGLYIYGDYSGKNLRTNSNEHDYDVVFRVLKEFTGTRENADKSMRVITNQSVKHRKDFMNKIFYGSLPIRFTISPRCLNTIKDCEFLRQAPDGGKIKEKDKDDNEKYGHCSDEMEYFFTSAFNKYFNI